MKTKRIVAFILIALVQIGACLALVVGDNAHTRSMERDGEHYRLAIQSVTSYRSNNQTFVNIVYPPALPLPEEEYSADTTVYVLSVGSDGLARQAARGVSFEEAEQLPDLMLSGVSTPRAVWETADSVRSDLEVLSNLMYQIQSLSGQDPAWIAPELQKLREMPQEIADPALRALAQRQLDTMNGDELADSYAEAIVYDGTLYLQDLYIAGVHIASLQTS